MPSFCCINTMKSFKYVTESLLSFNVWFQHVRNHLVWLGYSVFKKVSSSGEVLNQEGCLFIKYATIVVSVKMLLK